MAATTYYPMYVSLEGRTCLVIGAGTVGERKVRGLLRCGGTVRLLAPRRTPWLEEQCRKGVIALIGERYEVQHLEGVDLVFATTDDSALNRRIAQDARRCRIWCNTATTPEEGSFIVPSVVQRGPLSLAISTGGSSPALARIIRKKLEDAFGTEWIFFIQFMGELRAAVQAKGLESALNQRMFREVATLPLTEWIRTGAQTQATGAVHEICRPWLTLEELDEIWNKVWKLLSSSSPPSVTSLERWDT